MKKESTSQKLQFMLSFSEGVFHPFLWVVKLSFFIDLKMESIGTFLLWKMKGRKKNGVFEMKVNWVSKSLGKTRFPIGF